MPRRSHHQVDGSELRRLLIEAGVLVPVELAGPRLTPVLGTGRSVLRLDALGRRAAARRVELGRRRIWDQPVDRQIHHSVFDQHDGARLEPLHFED